MFVMEPHSFGVLKGINGSVCRNCGLVRFNNYLTDWAVKYGCNNDEHPQYASACRTLPKMWMERRNG